MIRLLGIFIPLLREMPEIMYQFDRDFKFDSSKFISRFSYVPKSNREAIRETIDALKNIAPDK
jgi:hypothetical protein